MLGQVYTASTTGVSVSALQDLIEIEAPADACIIIISAHFGQAGTADYGDAQAEGLRVRWVRGEGATTGSGGSTPTPEPHMSGFSDSGATVKMNNTTLMSAGTRPTVLTAAFNVQVGYFYQPAPEERIVISAGDRLTLELIAAPSDELSACETSVTYMEIGG